MFGHDEIERPLHLVQQLALIVVLGLQISDPLGIEGSRLRALLCLCNRGDTSSDMW